MALSFFRALDPTSKQSGIVYIAGEKVNEEITDLTVGENIRMHLDSTHKNPFDFDEKTLFQKIQIIYNVIAGEHYTIAGMGYFDTLRYVFDKEYAKQIMVSRVRAGLYGGSTGPKKGTKGLLDFLIFPLIARKIIADSFLPERKDQGVFLDHLTSLSMGIAFALEVVRFTAAVTLTLLAAPFVLLIEAIAACLENFTHPKAKII